MHFRDLQEPQLLALAITSEEEDGRIYHDFAEKLRPTFPATAELFERMAEEESGHRHRLLDLYQRKFGEHVPLIRRQDVEGFNIRRPSWLTTTLRPEHAREEAALMEQDARRFYEAAIEKTRDAAVRQLLGDLAEEESKARSDGGERQCRANPGGAVERERETGRRLFVLRFIQPGLAGLMDGSVSTLRPSLRQPLPRRSPKRPSRWASPLRSGQASAWASPKRCR